MFFGVFFDNIAEKTFMKTYNHFKLFFNKPFFFIFSLALLVLVFGKNVVHANYTVNSLIGKQFIPQGTNAEVLRLVISSAGAGDTITGVTIENTADFTYFGKKISAAHVYLDPADNGGNFRGNVTLLGSVFFSSPTRATQKINFNTPQAVSSTNALSLFIAYTVDSNAVLESTSNVILKSVSAVNTAPLSYTGVTLNQFIVTGLKTVNVYDISIRLWFQNNQRYQCYNLKSPPKVKLLMIRFLLKLKMIVEILLHHRTQQMVSQRHIYIMMISLMGRLPINLIQVTRYYKLSITETFLIQIHWFSIHHRLIIKHLHCLIQSLKTSLYFMILVKTSQLNPTQK